MELRYHVLGLSYAGSRYAWPALGSCLALHVDMYASARGFPKRLAGEDHYLLQKACKLGPIFWGQGLPVRIQARRSSRTPFGTGQSVQELLQTEPLALNLRDPRCYIWLRRLLTELDALGGSGDWSTFTDWLATTQGECPLVALTLERVGALRNWSHTCELALSFTARTRRLHEWFDGLRQIQFLRGLEPAYPPLGHTQALLNAPFTKIDASTSVATGSGDDPGGDATWQLTARRLAKLTQAGPKRPNPLGV